MGSHVSGWQAANRLIETVIAPNFCRFQSWAFARDGNERDRSLLEFGRSGSLMIPAAENAVGSVQTSAAQGGVLFEVQNRL
jgi:hypothetical protein